jgi:hypothetical protein
MAMHIKAGWVATLGFATLLIGGVGLKPAQAQDYGRDDRRDIHQDLRDYRQDRRRLDALDDRRAAFQRCHDWDRGRDIDRQIDFLRRDMARDRRDLRHELQRTHRDRDHDRDYDGYRVGYWHDRG